MYFKTMTLAAALILPTAAALAQDAQTQNSEPATAAAPTAQPADAAESTPADAHQGHQAPAAAADAVVLAAPADVKVGLVVNDQNGQNVGKIESVTTEGAVIATDKVKAQVPLSSFGKKGETLVVGITKAEFEAAVAKSTPPS